MIPLNHKWKLLLKKLYICRIPASMLIIITVLFHMDHSSLISSTHLALAILRGSHENIFECGICQVRKSLNCFFVMVIKMWICSLHISNTVKVSSSNLTRSITASYHPREITLHFFSYLPAFILIPPGIIFAANIVSFTGPICIIFINLS